MTDSTRFASSCAITLALFVATACGDAIVPTDEADPRESPSDSAPTPALPDAAAATPPIADAGKPLPPNTPDASTDAAKPPAPDAGPTAPGWKISWQDEFDGASIDTSKWGFDTGAGGWGNGELQYYTDRTDNAAVAGGMLRITAKRESFSGPKGNAEYTSARLLSRGKFEQKYGRFEARIKLPVGQGIWPAFWMLGGNLGSAGWPGCGEIDIMENIGKASEGALSYATIHGPDQAGRDYYGGAGIGSKFQLASGRLADDFHVFRVEWEPRSIQFFVDDVQTVDKATGVRKEMRAQDLPAGWKWVFDDNPFFMILNVAVGGMWPGPPDGTTPLPQTMLVDYVRVYSKDVP